MGIAQMHDAQAQIKGKTKGSHVDSMGIQLCLQRYLSAMWFSWGLGNVGSSQIDCAAGLAMNIVKEDWNEGHEGTPRSIAKVGRE